MRPVGVHSVTRCTLFALFSRDGPLIEPMLNSSTVPWVSPQFCIRLNQQTNSDNQENTNPANVQNYCSTEAETGLVLISAQLSLCLDTEISVLYSFLHPKISCINMFRSGSCSQPIRLRICRRAVTLYFNLHWNSQILAYGSQR